MIARVESVTRGRTLKSVRLSGDGIGKIRKDSPAGNGAHRLALIAAGETVGSTFGHHLQRYPESPDIVDVVIYTD